MSTSIVVKAARLRKLLPAIVSICSACTEGGPGADSDVVTDAWIASDGSAPEGRDADAQAGNDSGATTNRDAGVRDAAALVDASATRDGGVARVDAGEPDACVPLQVFRDADSDLYGDPAHAMVVCGMVPGGYVTNDDDCYDRDRNVKPGARGDYQAEDRGDGSFDYDCDGVEAPRYPTFGSCPTLDPSCPPPPQWPEGFECDYSELTTSGTEGWYRSCLETYTRFGYTHCARYGSFPVPACGTRELFKANAASCPGDPISVVQRCR